MPMRSHLEFRSAALLNADGSDDEVRGESAARLLADQLSHAGYEIIEVAPEDWGWRVSFRNEGFPLWLGCGHYGEYPDGHLCFIQPSSPHVRRGLKRVATSEVVESLASAIERVLRASSQVSELRWWTEAEARLEKG